MSEQEWTEHEERVANWEEAVRVLEANLTDARETAEMLRERGHEFPAKVMEAEVAKIEAQIAEEREVMEAISRSERVVVAATEPLMGQHIGQVPLQIHKPEKCEGHPCPFHDPSDHHMRDWPKIVRLDKEALVERTCEHGVGHPDPDSLAYFMRLGRDYLGVHGCDGCCRAAGADEQ